MTKVRKQVGKRRKRPVRKTRSSSVLDRAVPFESQGELKISIYGKSGTGKTTLWSTFPGPILAVLCSGGKGTNELDSVSPKNRKKIKRLMLPGPVLSSCDDLLQLALELETDTHFKTIVIDHLSAIQDLRITEILGYEEVPVQKSWGMAKREQYGERANNIKQYLRRFMDLSNKIVVFVSQEGMVSHDDEAGELDLLPTIGPYLSSSVNEWFNPACNYVCRTFIREKVKRITVGRGKKKKVVERLIKGENEYCLWTGPSDIYTSKFRMPKEYVKPAFIVDPTYEKLMTVINGGKV